MANFVKAFSKIKNNTWLPFWMPWVWKLILLIAFSIGLSIGTLIAVWMLQIRGII